jgi:hypothetical protein
MLIVFGFAACGHAAEEAQKVEYTNRREVMQNEALRRDFTLQGEYTVKKEGETYGLQLIADGGGKFRFAGYYGGLPNEHWQTDDPRVLGNVILEDNTLQFETTKFYDLGKEQALEELPQEFKSFKAVYEIVSPQRPENNNQRVRGLAGPTVTLKAGLGSDSYEFQKVVRRSPTLGEKAPEGAVVIFDGSHLDQFEPGARLNESQRPAQNTLWSEALTKPLEQKPFHLHLEFLTSYMPTAHGQGRSNSGVYLNECYECQILDSFGLNLANNECGGFYSIKAPDINACFPPLTWQTYDFFFTPPKYDGDKKVENARLTLKLNGVTIHNDIELIHETPGRKREANEPRGLYLQGHGNNVQYRNIWVKYQ